VRLPRARFGATLVGVKVQRAIEEKLTSALSPTHLVVENESHMHAVKPGSESHFKVLVVSEAFEGKSRVERQRRVNEILRDELAQGLHALSMRALTPNELARGGADGFVSPKCLGGSKAS
jgi:BolA protein